MSKWCVIVLGMLLPVLASGQKRASAAEVKPRTLETVRIGMNRTMFRDVPEVLILKLVEPFGELVETQLGVPGQITLSDDISQLGKKLTEDQLDLGVFQGLEFAWAQHQYPDLRPLMIVYNQQRYVQVYLMVRDDSTIKGFADLKGKALAMPRFSRVHCYQFLERNCQQTGEEARDMLAKVTTPLTVENALEDLVEGRVDAAIIEKFPYELYDRRKPARCARLKIVQESEWFPASVVAYHAGAFDESTLKRFQKALQDAPQVPIGRQMLSLWRLSGFDTVPNDYQEKLDKVFKVYPPPPAEPRDKPRASGKP